MIGIVRFAAREEDGARIGAGLRRHAGWPAPRKGAGPTPEDPDGEYFKPFDLERELLGTQPPMYLLEVALKCEVVFRVVLLLMRLMRERAHNEISPIQQMLLIASGSHRPEQIWRVAFAMAKTQPRTRNCYVSAARLRPPSIQGRR